MILIVALQAILLFLFARAENEQKQEQKPAPIQGYSTPILKASSLRPEDGLVKCNNEMLTVYGLQGYANAVINPSKYCPVITQNCCSPTDEETAMSLWKFEHRFKIERYYDIYFYALKYLLGYSQEAYLLAREYSQSDVSECRAAGLDLMNMNFNAKITMDVFAVYKQSLQDVADLRKGFFCILCDARTQEKLKDFYASTNLFNRDRIYLSKEFCRKLVDDQIKASFYTSYYTKRYLENTATLINCKQNNSTKITYDIPVSVSQQVKNCYYFKNKYFFYFCEKYCENFHLTKASAVFDGDLIQLRKFVDHFYIYRRMAFNYPYNNILTDGLRYEESYLHDFYDEVLKDLVFIRPQMQQVMLDQVKTDVVLYGGMDPFESVDGSKFPFNYGRIDVLMAFLAFSWTFLVVS